MEVMGADAPRGGRWLDACAGAGGKSLQLAQLMQPGIELEPNTSYLLTVAAYSSSGRDMRVSLHQHDFPFGNYGLNRATIDLSTSWQTYTLAFTTPNHFGTLGDGRLYFWFADDAMAGDRFFIDQVSIAKQ